MSAAALAAAPTATVFGHGKIEEPASEGGAAQGEDTGQEDAQRQGTGTSRSSATSR
jgi:hypothetical protein